MRTLSKKIEPARNSTTTIERNPEIASGARFEEFFRAKNARGGNYKIVSYISGIGSFFMENIAHWENPQTLPLVILLQVGFGGYG
jgi:hypothetical protein